MARRDQGHHFCDSGRVAVATTVSPGEAACKLDQDRADATGTAGDQQGAMIDASAPAPRRGGSNSNSQAVIEVRGRAAPCANDKDLGLAADDALIDQMKFRIGALAQDRGRRRTLHRPA